MSNRNASSPASHTLIARLGAHERVTGRYRFQSLNRRRNTDGFEVWHVRLADRSGVLDTYVPCKEAEQLYPLPTDLLVHAEFRTRPFQNRLVADLLDLDPLIDGGEANLALDRLPRPTARDPRFLDELAELLGSLTNTVLRAAIDRVLANDALALDWINAGDGLFAQSVTAAGIALELPRLAREERELALVACLFRRLGELPLFDPWAAEWGQPPGVAPGCLTLERCAPALQCLDEGWPEAARCLRQLWSIGLAPISEHTPLALAHAVELACELASRPLMVPPKTEPVPRGMRRH